MSPYFSTDLIKTTINKWEDAAPKMMLNNLEFCEDEALCLLEEWLHKQLNAVKQAKIGKMPF